MDSTACWAIIVALATTVATMGAYIAKLWAAHAKEVKELNEENKAQVREMLEELKHD